jgi:hypothetical protein
VDVYFLFDLSGSMGDEKNQLAIIAKRLAEVREPFSSNAWVPPKKMIN